MFLPITGICEHGPICPHMVKLVGVNVVEVLAHLSIMFCHLLDAYFKAKYARFLGIGFVGFKIPKKSCASSLPLSGC